MRRAAAAAEKEKTVLQLRFAITHASPQSYKKTFAIARNLNRHRSCLKSSTVWIACALLLLMPLKRVFLPRTFLVCPHTFLVPPLNPTHTVVARSLVVHNNTECVSSAAISLGTFEQDRTKKLPTPNNNVLRSFLRTIVRTNFLLTQRQSIPNSRQLLG